MDLQITNRCSKKYETIQPLPFNYSKHILKCCYSLKIILQYDALALGISGGGGEYAPQLGFGWTNGVVLEFLNQWDYLYYNTSNDNTTD